MFYKDSENIYRARPLEDLEWLVHGFGTRDAAVPQPLATLKQVHSTVCVAADGRAGILGQGDALVENTRGHAVGVKTADCTPILLADVRTRAVAAVHAGWRGTAGRIAAAALETMRDRFGTNPEDVRAAIGPAIGPCCYEVGAEVAAQFGLGEGRAHIDLAKINREQLVDCGVPSEHVYTARLCTMCLAGEFYSFRREKEHAGRMYSFIGLR